MLKRVHGFPHVGAAALLMAVTLAGCNDEKKTTSKPDAGVADAGPQEAVLGGKLGEAVAAAAAGVQDQKEDKPDGGPPETGVFGPGGADAAQAPNAPPALQLFGEGSDPKLPLTYALAPGSERKTTMQLQVVEVVGSRPAVIPLSLSLAFKSEKPKDDKKASKDKDKDKDKEKDKPAEVGSFPVELKILDAQSLQGGKLGDELENIKEVVVRYRLTNTGMPSELAIEYPKKSSETIQVVAESLVDVVFGMTVPVPDKPVGVGAMWMVTDRGHSSGVDVVRYRVAKLLKIDDKTATISVDLRQYAANSTFGLPGVPQELQLSLAAFGSQGKGELGLGPAAFLPSKGQFKIGVRADLTSPKQQQGQVLTIQTEVGAAVADKP